MSRIRSFVIRVGAPLVLVAGLAGVLAARRAVTLRNTIEQLADSLGRGSGPLALRLPFVPAYLEGRRIGRLDSVRLERHQARAVDSLRLVIELAGGPSNDPELKECTFQLVTFDPGKFKHALACAQDTAGLVPFGRVVFVQGSEAPLYVSANELECAPWTDGADSACIRARVQEQIRRDMRRARDEMRRNLRTNFR